MPTENQIDCPALHKRSSSYPFGDRVPRTVRMLKTVTADPMPGIGLACLKGNAPVAKAGQTYPVWTNSHGAVTAVMEDGTRLGLRPAEFEVDCWHDLATAPAAPHPEPIAWMVGTAIWWTKEEAERDAAEVGQPVIGLGPMVDTAEVERLSAENEQLREVIKHSDSNIQRQSLRISNQRAQLAEQDSLLREVLEAFKLEADGSCINPGRDFIRPWAAKLTALSASAEPRSPIECAICRDLGNQCMECEEGEFREWADRHFAAADYRKTDAGVFIQDWMRHAYGAWCARGALVRQS